MSAPFRIRHARLFGGAFLLLCTGLLLMALLTSRGWRDLWLGQNQQTFLVSCFIPGVSKDAENGKTEPTISRVLARGARVELLGQTVGSIEELWLGRADGGRWPEGEPLNEDCRMIGRVKVHGEFTALVRGDSKVVLHEDLGGFGGVFLEVLPGNTEELPDRPLRVKPATSARGSVEELVKKIDGYFFAPDGDGKKIAVNASELLAEAKKTLQGYTLDEKGKRSFDESLLALNENLKSLDVVLKKLGDKNIENEFPMWKKTLGELIEALEDIATASRELSDTNNRVQDTWLLRGKGEDADKKKGGQPPGTPAASPSRPPLSGVRKG